MGIRAAVIVSALVAHAVGAREVARYDFVPTHGAEVVVDRSGFDYHGEVAGEAAMSPEGALSCGGRGHAVLPGGGAIFGPEAARGGVTLWVRPDFDPGDLPHGQWEGYSMIFYAMETDGNGLPDGYDEIGIWCHGPYLRAKVSRRSAGPSFSVRSPLRKGHWTHLALTWGPWFKALYVNGALVDSDESANPAPLLDEFPAMLGQHPSSRRWAWRGDLADCRLHDDVLTDAQVAALAARRSVSDAPADLYGPDRPRIAHVDWGEVWMGPHTVRVRPTERAEGGSEALCEVLDEAGRHAFPPAAFEAAPGEAVALELRIAREGHARINLLVREREGGRVLAARSHFLSIPPLRPVLADVGRKIEQISGLLEAAPDEARQAAQQYAAEPRRAATARLEALAQAAQGPARRAEWNESREQAVALLADTDALLTRTAIYTRGAQDGVLPPFGLGVDHALRKYLKHDPFEGTLEGAVELRSARHEHEAAQVLVFALDEDLQGVRVEVGDLRGPDGAVIAREHITWNQLGYVETRKPTYEVRHVGLWPDPLLPTAPFDVAAGEFEIIWLTVYTPPDAAPGKYEGTLTIRPANVPSRELRLRLRVWDFALPERSSLTTAFGLNSMGAFINDMDVDRYVQNAFRHRISLGFPGAVFAPAEVTYPAFDLSGERLQFRLRAEAPEGVQIGPLFVVCETRGRRGARVYGPLPLRRGHWSEATLTMADDERPSTVRFEYRNAGPVKITVGALRSGRGVWDAMDDEQWWRAEGPWAQVTQAAEGLCLEIAAAPEGQELIERWPAMTRAAADTPADIPLRLDFTEFDRRIEAYLERGINAIPVPVPGCPRHISEQQARELVRANHLGPIARAYQEHLRDKGWLAYAYTYVSDEPEASDYPALNVVQGTIKQWAPDLPNMITARSFPPELEHVDIWCPEVYSFNPQAAAAEQAKGKQVWWYPAFSTRRPFPDFWVDYPAIDNRVLFWLTWKHKLDGLLYWSITNYWRADPWEHAMTFPGANGDGTLVYPGRHGGPVNSLRWECIRDGAEDYEYFVLLRDLVRRARDTGGLDEAGRALLGRAEELLAIEDGVARSWREWNERPEPLLAARNEMGETIEKLAKVVQ